MLLISEGVNIAVKGVPPSLPIKSSADYVEIKLNANILTPQ